MPAAGALPPCVALARDRHPLPHRVVVTLLRCVKRARLDALDPAIIAEIEEAERALVELSATGGVGDGRAGPNRGVGLLSQDAEA